MAAAFAEELPISAHHYFEDYAGRDHGTEVPTGASVIGSAGPPPRRRKSSSKVYSSGGIRQRRNKHWSW